MSKFAANGQADFAAIDPAAGPVPETVEGIVVMDATWARKRRMREQSAGPPAAGSSGRESSSHPLSGRAPSRPATSSRVPVSTPPVPSPAPQPDRREKFGSSIPVVPRPETPRPETPRPETPRPSASGGGGSAGQGFSEAELTRFLVNFVVEQTGYPQEIVEMDADLEADLGIDSIKKAQLFGELREHFDVTPSDDLSLDDFPTLADVRDYLRGHGVASGESSRDRNPQPAVGSVPPLTPSSVTVPSPPPAASPASGSSIGGFEGSELEAFLVNFVVEQTGYPQEIVEMDADLEADLGIDSIKKAQLFGELREHFDVTPSDDLSLDDFPTLADVRDYLFGEQGAASTSGTASTATSTTAISSTAKGVSAAAMTQPPTAKPHQTASPQATGLDGTELEAFLVNFVVEQTGYPEEIVDMDADLEADLGIDSIKKAQLFGELREHFDVTPSDDLSLDDFPTLAHVRDYLVASRR